MGLNENTAKLDQQLDNICKKLERVAIDTGNLPNGRLMFKSRNEEQEYLQYIEQFSWNDLKFSSKKSLAELVAVITKEMRAKDDQVKKQ